MINDTLPDEARPALLKMAADIVAAYVTRNAITASELPAFIARTYASVAQLATGAASTVTKLPNEPAIPIKKSVTNDFIVCLEDGRKFTSLRRHLSTAHGMTPEDYRTKWGLPVNYPMAAPAYTAVRSTLAKQSGLGQKTDPHSPNTRRGTQRSVSQRLLR